MHMRAACQAAIVAVAVLALTGCVVVPPGTFPTSAPVTPPATQATPASEPSPTAAPAPAPTPAEPSIPDGFTDAGSGIAYRFAEPGTELTDCSYYDSCVGVLVYSYDGCPSGGYIEANVLSGSAIVTFTNDLIPSMQAGDQYFSLLGTIGYGSGDLTCQLVEVDCY